MSENFQHYSYVARGIYVEQLRAYHALFPKDQLLILKAEDYFDNPALARRLLDVAERAVEVGALAQRERPSEAAVGRYDHLLDAVDVAETHDEAWRTAYQGIIPGNELDKLINRRGPDWWDSAIRKGSRITILQFGERVAGYANYGRNRARSLFYDGEIYEIYLRPEFQGLGFGRRLFSAARKDLNQSGLKSLVVWALSDNEPAMEFYRALGGRAVARSSERFGTKTLDKVAYAWQA